MILCHKDAGLLAARADEDTTGLLGCECISGWVRGFEPDLTRAEAIRKQIAHAEESIRLYMQQGREAHWITDAQSRRDKLTLLL